MPKPTEKQKIGRIGEDIAVKYLGNKGFTIIERNYRKKYGEIDIIAKKGTILHFIEVKTVSHENFVCFSGDPVGSVSLRPRREFANSETDHYRPEDNIHPYKLKRLARTIQVYLLEKFSKKEPEWQFDAITVRLDRETRRAKVKFLENIIL
ncbi:MAG: YraN family protein [Patescibacteria group bacterium]